MKSRALIDILIEAAEPIWMTQEEAYRWLKTAEGREFRRFYGLGKVDIFDDWIMLTLPSNDARHGTVSINLDDSRAKTPALGLDRWLDANGKHTDELEKALLSHLKVRPGENGRRIRSAHVDPYDPFDL